MTFKNDRSNRRRNAWLRAGGLLAMAGLLGLAGGDAASHSAAQGAARSNPAFPEAACAGDPSLPPLLEVVRDAADPNRVQIHVLGSIGASASVVIDGDQPVAWDSGKAPAAFRLRKGDATRTFALRSPLNDKSRPHRVRVGLELTDDQGRVWGHVNQEIDLGGGAPLPQAPKSLQVSGSAADGRSVVANVPAGAPAPVVTGGAQ